ncbi:hypothetical protein ACLB1S_27395 [Escherichia coli]
MRRLPGILLLTGAALVVIAALLVSGLRIALPHLDAWRPEILDQNRIRDWHAGRSQSLSASWQNFGPTLEAHDIRAELKDGGEFSVKRVTLALDVWQSLLHMRWQFRDLTSGSCAFAPTLLSPAVVVMIAWKPVTSAICFFVNLTISISATVKSVF